MSELRIQNGTWIIVADGEKALFLCNQGTVAAPELHVMREMEQDNPPTRDQGTSKPGRMSDGGPSHRSAVQETDWHRVTKAQFAKEISKKLQSLAQKGAFNKLILVASPMVLGELRKEMHGDVAKKIVGEVDKNMTGMPIDKIEKLLTT